MDSNPTLNFFHKVSTFTIVQDMSKHLGRVFAFTHKKVDNTSRTWPSVTFWIIKDKGHASLDSNILRQTKDQ